VDHGDAESFLARDGANFLEVELSVLCFFRGALMSAGWARPRDLVPFGWVDVESVHICEPYIK